MIDLKLRKAMALKLGWTHLSEEGLGGNVAPIYLRGTNPAKTKHRAKVPPYELSMDALLRDAEPKAHEAGYGVILERCMCDELHSFDAYFQRLDGSWTEPTGDATLAKAFCHAFLALP